MTSEIRSTNRKSRSVTSPSVSTNHVILSLTSSASLTNWRCPEWQEPEKQSSLIPSPIDPQNQQHFRCVLKGINDGDISWQKYSLSRPINVRSRNITSSRPNTCPSLVISGRSAPLQKGQEIFEHNKRQQFWSYLTALEKLSSSEGESDRAFHFDHYRVSAKKSYFFHSETTNQHRPQQEEEVTTSQQLEQEVVNRRLSVLHEAGKPALSKHRESLTSQSDSGAKDRRGSIYYPLRPLKVTVSVAPTRRRDSTAHQRRPSEAHSGKPIHTDSLRLLNRIKIKRKKRRKPKTSEPVKSTQHPPSPSISISSRNAHSLPRPRACSVLPPGEFGLFPAHVAPGASLLSSIWHSPDPCQSPLSRRRVSLTTALGRRQGPLPRAALIARICQVLRIWERCPISPHRRPEPRVTKEFDFKLGPFPRPHWQLYLLHPAPSGFQMANDTDPQGNNNNNNHTDDTRQVKGYRKKGLVGAGDQVLSERLSDMSLSESMTSQPSITLSSVDDDDDVGDEDMDVGTPIPSSKCHTLQKSLSLSVPPLLLIDEAKRPPI